MFIDRLDRLFFGENGGLRNSDVVKAARRDSFSRYLPWKSYVAEKKLYILNEIRKGGDPNKQEDHWTGFIWECVPLCFAGEQATNMLSGIFRAGLPEQSIIQFVLYADSNVDAQLDTFRKLKVRHDDVSAQILKRYIEFIKKGTKGFQNVSGIPVRSFRLFVCVKMPPMVPDKPETHYNLQDIYNNMSETLRAASTWPHPVTPDELVLWGLRFFNDRDFTKSITCDPSRPISSQMILSDTKIVDHFTHLAIGKRSFKCITPKRNPPKISALTTNYLFGGIWGTRSDGDQIKTPFLYSLNVCIDKTVAAELHTKCNLTLQQKGVGSLSSLLAMKQAEYLDATAKLNQGTQYVRIIPTFWVWGDDDDVRDTISRIKRVWEASGFEMQEDMGILKPLFLASMPLGLVNEGDNIENMERHTPVEAELVCHFAPIQADFSGGGLPYLLFFGRKGQICTLDLFAREATNYNAYIVAGTGAGKSVLLNYIISNYYDANAKVTVIDIGHSYRKQCAMKKGAYLDFDDKANICINPFANVGYEKEDITADLAAISAIILQMIVSATGKLPEGNEESCMTLIKAAVLWAYEQQCEKLHEDFFAGIDTVHEYLIEFPRYAGSMHDKLSENTKDKLQMLAHELAFNLGDFITSGIYGKWFNGKSNFDLSKSEFTILELDNLKTKGDLFQVVLLQIINAVTYDLYIEGQKDRTKKRLIYIDEAWQLLKGDNPRLKNIIENGYRRARKAGGSFCIVSQSPLDLQQFGDIGQVIMSNSQFEFYLKSKDYEKAYHEKLLQVDEMTLELLKTVNTVNYQYSEIFIRGPHGSGVVRLILDPYSYFTYSTAPKDVAEFHNLVADGKSYDEAIQTQVDNYGHHWANAK